MSRWMLSIAVIVLAAPAVARADDLRVPGDFPTLAGALSAAERGDVIRLKRGVRCHESLSV
jgi:hypothetical protein